jgi:hypothetical protein
MDLAVHLAFHLAVQLALHLTSLGLEHCEWKYQLQAMLMMVAVDSKVDLA